MTKNEVIKLLESEGTAQNRKTYGRHGVRGTMFGVSFANLEKLRRTIKTDHALAQGLWETGNHDARVLATMVADPAAFDDRTLEAWVKSLDNPVIADLFSRTVARTRFAKAKVTKWTKAESELVGQVGLNLVGALAMGEALEDAYFEPMLETIERDVHASENRVRNAMIAALIAIGARSASLEKRAVAAAKRIGTVHVDHGETNCKTPDPIPYIRKMRARARARKTPGPRGR